MLDEESSIILQGIEPDRHMARFYSLTTERDLFGPVVLVRNWGRMGTRGEEMVEAFPDEGEAAQAALANAKRRRGY